MNQPVYKSTSFTVVDRVLNEPPFIENGYHADFNSYNIHMWDLFM